MFRSFVLGGFDCTVGRNAHGELIDHTVATGHSRRLDEDYRLLKALGIRAVRDGMPWPAIETRPGVYDWSRLDRIAEAGDRHGIEIVYDLCHFGYPEHLDVFGDDFVRAFAAYCYAAAERLRKKSVGARYFTPLNEPSYFAWAAGDAARFYPHRTGVSHELKIQFVRAILAGTDAIFAALPNAVMVNADPMCRTVAPRARPDLDAAAETFNACAVMESWDMLSGKLYPELGGSRAYLGILGVNYYWTNQWELGDAEVPLADDDERVWSLSRLVQTVWERYHAPIVISETSHIGDARAGWVRRLAHEAKAMLAADIPLHGVCLYPVLGMPAWHARTQWLRMGLWDVGAGPSQKRTAYEPMLAALAELRDVRPTRPAFDRHERAVG
ncbi:MAG TPA: family 1 glycosylhydrolase [Candidatus Elarobacter sp.]